MWHGPTGLDPAAARGIAWLDRGLMLRPMPQKKGFNGCPKQPLNPIKVAKRA